MDEFKNALQTLISDAIEDGVEADEIVLALNQAITEVRGQVDEDVSEDQAEES